MRWILGKWYAHQRLIDLRILWPACLEYAKEDIERARAAFAEHAFHDSAWLWIGPKGINDIINRLT